jgi:hypothetical protein
MYRIQLAEDRGKERNAKIGAALNLKTGRGASLS